MRIREKSEKELARTHGPRSRLPTNRNLVKPTTRLGESRNDNQAITGVSIPTPVMATSLAKQVPSSEVGELVAMCTKEGAPKA